MTCIHRLIENGHIERNNFVQAAVRWSRQANSSSTSTESSTTAAGANASTNTGHPLLHAQFALTYWQGIVTCNESVYGTIVLLEQWRELISLF